ncbi:zinc-binding dehydrogenase [Pseudokineococcus basanitobsidens]|uniref:Zinc-binding dehydrogenase n=1 Tax=Pseudokineococcus basanitobsidens TaxID=1926649 RepID=A0ABU8RPB0_9ACTN
MATSSPATPQYLRPTSVKPKAELARRLGADEVLDMGDEDAVAAAEGSVDYVLSTIPTAFDMNPYLGLLRAGGALHSVGMLETVHHGGIDFGVLTMKHLTVGSSLIGNIAETQEVLEFSAEHGISAEVQVIAVQQINEAFDRMVAGEVRFRYVIDNASLRDDRAATTS